VKSSVVADGGSYVSRYVDAADAACTHKQWRNQVEESYQHSPRSILWFGDVRRRDARTGIGADVDRRSGRPDAATPC
jgi:hypothetical protein